MSILIAGVVAWSLAHLLPAIAPLARQRLAKISGENAFRGLFSLVIFASLLLMVFGWSSAEPKAVYTPPLTSGLPTTFAILVAFVLFVASQIPGNIKRYLRHPQMTATIFWGVAHLLTNGDNRDVIFFGGLSLWAALEILMINRRDGSWQKPGPALLRFDVLAVGLGALGFALVWRFHAVLFGVAPISVL